MWRADYSRVISASSEVTREDKTMASDTISAVKQAPSYSLSQRRVYSNSSAGSDARRRRRCMCRATGSRSVLICRDYSTGCARGSDSQNNQKLMPRGEAIEQRTPMHIAGE